MSDTNESIFDIIDTVFEEDGVLSSLKGDYIPRTSQIEGARKIKESLISQREIKQKTPIEDDDYEFEFDDTKYATGRHVLMEGPCGFGKTLAYLIPVIERVIKEGSRVIIATDGIALQDQLYNKDLPLVKKVFDIVYPGKEFKFEILKGRQNYVCQKKISSINTFSSSKILDVSNWARKTSTGDLSELDFVLTYDELNEVACVNREDCDGAKCSLRSECHYQVQKAKASEASVVIVNYHLLLSDIEVYGKVLGKYDILVMDEAHQLADIYRGFKEKSLSIASLKKVKTDILKALDKFGLKITGGLSSGFRENIDIIFGLLEPECRSYFSDFYNLYFKDNKFHDVKIVDSRIIIPRNTDKIKELLDRITTALEREISASGDEFAMVESEEEDLGDYATYLSSISDRIRLSARLMSDISTLYDDKKDVYWIDKSATKNDISSEHRIAIKRRPVDISDLLKAEFFDTKTTCILTSATLSVGGTFSFIKRQLGLSDYDKNSLCEYIGSSPFDLQNQELWFLHPDVKVPKDAEYDKSVPELALEVITKTKGGALCLFTSIKSMNDCHDKISDSLKMYGIKLLKQGDAPKVKLVESFSKDKDSVLFATRSFFTGVDVPGDSLRCIVLDKLPFPVPTDPTVKKLSDNAYNGFMDISIPMMTITLKQIIGRGVRSITDKCVICILDGRVSASVSRYAGFVFDSFNYTKTATRDLQDVSKFLFPEDEFDDKLF